MATRLERIAVSSAVSRIGSARGIKPHERISPTRPDPADAVLDVHGFTANLMTLQLASRSPNTRAAAVSPDPYFADFSEWRPLAVDAPIDSWTTSRAACPQLIVPTELVVRVSCGAGRNDTRHNNERKAHSATK